MSGFGAAVEHVAVALLRNEAERFVRALSGEPATLVAAYVHRRVKAIRQSGREPTAEDWAAMVEQLPEVCAWAKEKAKTVRGDG